MLSSYASQIGLTLRSPRLLAGLALLAAATAGVTSYVLTRRKPSQEDLERDRRAALAAHGRIVDGSITETHWQPNSTDPTPDMLVYRYRIAGVTYECAQDVGPLREHVRDVRIDLPVQVRFDPRNPGDSIVVSETWSGLRIDHEHPVEPFSIPSDS